MNKPLCRESVVTVAPPCAAGALTPVPPRIARLVAAVVLLLVTGGGLRAQNSVRAWGEFLFDTEGRHGRFVDVDAGEGVAVVLRDDGRLFTQGLNSNLYSLPSWPGNLDIPPPPAGLHYVRCRVNGGSVSFAQLSDGSIQGWGWWFLPSGQVAQPSDPPAPVGTRYVDFGVGLQHIILLRSDGMVVAFGRNHRGQTNVPAFPTSPTKVRAVADASFAILADGSLVAWGSNQDGLLNVPALPPGVRYTDVSGVVTHVVAQRSDGSVVAWGNNTWGQCNVPALPAQTKYLLASAGAGHTVAWRSDGVFLAWGAATRGSLNVPQVPAGLQCTHLAAGHSCALATMSDGSVISWGDNDFYTSSIPALPRTASDSPLAPIRSIGTNYYHSMLVLSDGTVRGFGNEVGVPGLHIPPPGTDGKFVKVACGYGSNIGLMTDGSLVAWGTITTGATVPPLPPGVRYTDVATGLVHVVAIRSDGQAVAFGPNFWGELNIPAPPPGVRYLQGACEYGKTMLVRSDGRIVAVGSHDTTAGNVPALPAGVRYVQVAAPEFFSGALRSDGLVEIWGSIAPDATFLPPLPFGVTYVEVSGLYTLLGVRRSDGQIVVAGVNTHRAAFPPPLDPGTSFVEVAAGGFSVLGRVGPTSTYVTFATGCAGSLPAARLVPMDTPRIGHGLEINLFDLPANAAFVALGWQRIAPTSLAPVGMPGCDLQISIDDVALVAGQSGTATHRVEIPDRPALIGTHFFHQALVLDPAAGNPFGAVVSNAAEGVVGDW